MTTTAFYGLALCIPFTVFAIGTFWVRPRLWLHSLPPDIQEMAGPKTDREVRQTKWLLIAYLLLLPGGSIVSLLFAAASARVELTVVGAFVHLYGVWVIVQLWDLVIIDVGHILFIDPDSPPIPGTNGAAGYKDFAFHARAFAKACFVSLVFVGPAALVLGLAL
ncbi:MAG: hypothetical protein OEQ39_07805 [Gammaproteobacteria bacterium]|nr:hypothetical protein [Gammaproteobacteria bacterium]